MIEIRIESDWDTDDGEGRAIEVRVITRRAPDDDPSEDSRYFAAHDLEPLKDYLSRLIDRHSGDFEGRDRSECVRCNKVMPAGVLDEQGRCGHCRPTAP